MAPEAGDEKPRCECSASVRAGGTCALARALEYVRSDSEERDEINRIIMEELVCGKFTPEAIGFFQQVIGRMQRDGCDAVVLGCTEKSR